MTIASARITENMATAFGQTGLEDVWRFARAVWSQSCKQFSSGLDVSLMDYFLYTVLYILLCLNALVFLTYPVTRMKQELKS